MGVRIRADLFYVHQYFSHSKEKALFQETDYAEAFKSTSRFAVKK
ncbi:imidazoleglycerol phosphate synthase glutamine amidotransferase subunit HisH [Bacillus alveayuensis]|uniref:Imidazoleglycerol phosphate synthase glutamine amidotransferase subunit HisH n=1 Tax=Aeribacillus alveayuensis TaxID=279215 RepID=A0ABT9VP97_9BACI|nr:imidazoleglycerol phosphate synthase glutamine amidotransferase subunit HisH [Bacillus alveayuensis]